jgi:RES domain-containing protein
LITVWRIVDPLYAGNAFSGIGAEAYGGRFNSKGRKVVYASGSLSLAMLEMLVQANKRSRLAGHLCISAAFDDSAVEILSRDHLPEGWDARPYTNVSQRIGDEWWDEKRSLVLRVPSVIVPQEHNYLIDPTHPNFGEVAIGEAFPIPFDSRLIE